MGTWGTGIFSNDLACDVRDMYRDYLACGYADDVAEEKVIEYWISQLTASEEDEEDFWLALAATEHKYGRMSERVKGKAFCFIQNDSLHEWNEKQAKGRKKALEKLAHTLSAPSDRKRIPAIHPQTVEWKAGDIVLAKLDMHENDDQKYFAMQVFTVFHMPYSQFIPDGPQEQIPVVGIYRWIGSNIPSMDELLRCGFVTSPHYPTKPQNEKPPYVSCMTLSKMDRKRHSYSVIRNSTDYLHIIDAQSVTSHIGTFWGNFDAYIALLKHQIGICAV